MRRTISPEVAEEARPRSNPYNPAKPKRPIVEYTYEKERIYKPIVGGGSEVRIVYENGDQVEYRVPYQVPDFLY